MHGAVPVDDVGGKAHLAILRHGIGLEHFAHGKAVADVVQVGAIAIGLGDRQHVAGHVGIRGRLLGRRHQGAQDEAAQVVATAVQHGRVVFQLGLTFVGKDVGQDVIDGACKHLRNGMHFRASFR